MRKILGLVTFTLMLFACRDESAKEKYFEDKLRKNLEDAAFKLNSSFNILELKVLKVESAPLDSVYKELAYERLNELFGSLEVNNSEDYSIINKDKKYNELLNRKKVGDTTIRGFYVYYYIKGVLIDPQRNQSNILYDKVLAYFDNNKEVLHNKLSFTNRKEETLLKSEPQKENTVSGESLTNACRQLFFNIDLSMPLIQVFNSFSELNTLDRNDGGITGIGNSEVRIRGVIQDFEFNKLSVSLPITFSKGIISIDTIDYDALEKKYKDDKSLNYQIADRLQSSNAKMTIYFNTETEMNKAYETLFNYFKEHSLLLQSDKDWEDLRQRNGNMLFGCFFTGSLTDKIKQVQVFKVIENVSNPRYFLVVQPYTRYFEPYFNEANQYKMKLN